MRSVTLAMTIPTIIMAAVTTTGLSPEFHLARFKMGMAGCLRDLLSVSQSVINHRSKARLLLLSLVVVVVEVEDESAATADADAAASLRSSKYSFTCPRDLEMANFDLDTGTTSLDHTRAQMTQRIVKIPNPIKVLVSGRMGSKLVVVEDGTDSEDEVAS